MYIAVQVLIGSVRSRGTVGWDGGAGGQARGGSRGRTGWALLTLRKILVQPPSFCPCGTNFVRFPGKSEVDPPPPSGNRIASP